MAKTINKKISVEPNKASVKRSIPRQPLYLKVAKTLQKEIEQGEHIIGDTLPTEEMLVNRFRVSRHTIREALRELKGQGFILARAGIGTIVRTQPDKIWLMRGLNSLVDLLEFATETEMHFLSKAFIKANHHLAKETKCELNSEWFQIEAIRRLPEQTRPLSYLKVYIQPKYAHKLKKVNHLFEPIYALLEREFDLRITEVHQEITADSLDHNIAELLEATPGQAALRITRLYYDKKGEVVQMALGFYPSGRYTQTTRIQSKLEE
jgi:DNA-binding GntR family transcriptional regulator